MKDQVGRFSIFLSPMAAAAHRPVPSRLMHHRPSRRSDLFSELDMKPQGRKTTHHRLPPRLFQSDTHTHTRTHPSFRPVRTVFPTRAHIFPRLSNADRGPPVFLYIPRPSAAGALHHGQHGNWHVGWLDASRHTTAAAVSSPQNTTVQHMSRNLI